jgi:hypothetical protein
MFIKSIKIVVAVMMCFAVMAVSSGNVFAGKIYVWTDENGVKHFSDVPPPDKKLDDLEIRGSESHNGTSINKPQKQSKESLEIQKRPESLSSSYNVPGDIKLLCEKKWGSNYKMILYCIKNQSAAKRAINNSQKDEISRFCKDKWGQNYEMIDYCIKNQRAAKENIELNYSGYKRKRCEKKWGNNYEMIEYCIKNQ